MSRASEILNNTLEAVNKNNAISISFSNRERIVIKNMMKQYAEECAKASLGKASDNLEMTLDQRCTDWIDQQDKINSEENIVLL